MSGKNELIASTGEYLKAARDWKLNKQISKANVTDKQLQSIWNTNRTSDYIVSFMSSIQRSARLRFMQISQTESKQSKFFSAANLCKSSSVVHVS